MRVKGTICLFLLFNFEQNCSSARETETTCDGFCRSKESYGTRAEEETTRSRCPQPATAAPAGDADNPTTEERAEAKSVGSQATLQGSECGAQI